MSSPADVDAAGAEAEDFPPLPDDHGRVLDMDDAVELELGCLPSPELRAAIQYCQQKLLPRYDETDKRALRHQKLHQRFTVFAALTGAFAVLFAIMQLTPLEEWLPPALLLWGEPAAALSAVAAVGWGSWAAFRINWLLERHKAERFRLLKFCALFDPKLLKASGLDISDWQQWLDGEIKKIEDLNIEQLEAWLTSDPVIAVPVKWQGVQVTDAFLLALIKYFKVKRLGVQRTYFAKRTQRNKQLNRRTFWVPLSFFFFSVGMALLHFVFDLVGPIAERYGLKLPGFGAAMATAHAAGESISQTTHEWPPHWWGLILLAAALPVVGAAFRTVRSANEFSRHMIRYRAKYIGLSLHVKKLEDEAQKLEPSTNSPVPAADAQRILLDLWGSEQIMESEHREWLRLMIEAEWFG